MEVVLQESTHFNGATNWMSVEQANENGETHQSSTEKGDLVMVVCFAPDGSPSDGYIPSLNDAGAVSYIMTSPSSEVNDRDHAVEVELLKESEPGVLASGPVSEDIDVRDAHANLTFAGSRDFSYGESFDHVANANLASFAGSRDYSYAESFDHFEHANLTSFAGSRDYSYEKGDDDVADIEEESLYDEDDDDEGVTTVSALTEMTSAAHSNQNGRSLSSSARSSLTIQGGRQLAEVEGCRRLASAFNLLRQVQHNRQLRKLSLYSNNIGDEGIAVLMNALPSSVVDLNLRCNLLTARGAVAIAKAASSFLSLQRLDLGYNRLGDLGVCMIVSASFTDDEEEGGEDAKAEDLQRETDFASDGTSRTADSIQELYLFNNGIGPAGARAIAASLERHTSRLRELQLQNNFICDEGILAISNALSNRGTASPLQKLHVDNNCITNEGAMGVLTAGSGLQILSLRDNCIGADCVRRITGCQEESKNDDSSTTLRSLQVLDLGGNVDSTDDTVTGQRNLLEDSERFDRGVKFAAEDDVATDEDTGTADEDICWCDTRSQESSSGVDETPLSPLLLLSSSSSSSCTSVPRDVVILNEGDAPGEPAAQQNASRDDQGVMIEGIEVVYGLQMNSSLGCDQEVADKDEMEDSNFAKSTFCPDAPVDLEAHIASMEGEEAVYESDDDITAYSTYEDAKSHFDELTPVSDKNEGPDENESPDTTASKNNNETSILQSVSGSMDNKNTSSERVTSFPGEGEGVLEDSSNRNHKFCDEESLHLSPQSTVAGEDLVPFLCKGVDGLISTTDNSGALSSTSSSSSGVVLNPLHAEGSEEKLLKGEEDLTTGNVSPSFATPLSSPSTNLKKKHCRTRTDCSPKSILDVSSTEQDRAACRSNVDNGGDLESMLMPLSDADSTRRQRKVESVDVAINRSIRHPLNLMEMKVAPKDDEGDCGISSLGSLRRAGNDDRLYEHQGEPSNESACAAETEVLTAFPVAPAPQSMSANRFSESMLKPLAASRKCSDMLETTDEEKSDDENDDDDAFMKFQINSHIYPNPYCAQTEGRKALADDPKKYQTRFARSQRHQEQQAPQYDFFKQVVGRI